MPKNHRMNFERDTEKTSYRTGKIIGFLISYILFFSIIYYILISRFHLIPFIQQFGYWYYIGAWIAIYALYKIIRSSIKIDKNYEIIS